MAVSFTKAAIMQGIGVLVGTLIRFGILSMAISLSLFLVAWASYTVQSHTGNQPLFQQEAWEFPQLPSYPPDSTLSNVSFFGITLPVNPADYLSQYPPFQYIGYAQKLWYLLLVPILIGGLIYILMLSQGNGMVRQVVDFIGGVAWPTMFIVGLTLIVWILVGGVIIIGLSTFSFDMMQEGLAGLSILGAGDVWSALQLVFTKFLPYFPIVVELSAFVYLFKELGTGWIGNQW